MAEFRLPPINNNDFGNAFSGSKTKNTDDSQLNIPIGGNKKPSGDDMLALGSSIDVNIKKLETKIEKLKVDLSNAKTPEAKQSIQSQINDAQRELDNLRSIA